MASEQDLKEIEKVFEATIKARRQLGRVVSAIGTVIEKEGEDMTALSTLQEAAATLRTNTTELASKVDALVTRLQDNPSPAEVTAVAGELSEISTGLASVGSSIDAIDPDVDGGVVPDPENEGGVTEEEAPA